MLRKSLRIWFLLLAFSAVSAGKLPEGEFALSEAASRVSARVAYLAISHKTVSFPALKGEFRYLPENDEQFSLLVTADARALDAGSSSETDILRGEDFFDTTRFQEVVFRGSRLSITGAKTALVSGTLSVRAVTRPLTLKVVFPRPLNEMAREGRVELTATARFKRSAYGMKAWQGFVGDRVNLNISATFDRLK